MLHRTLTLAALLAFSSILPGCILGELRDEARTTNQHLAEVKPALIHTLYAVEETNRRVEQATAQMELATRQVADSGVRVAEASARMAEVQAAMVQAQARIAESQVLLRQADEHLVAVTGTLGQTNPKLTEVEAELERMRILSEVHTSLKDVNSSLGPLGKAMGSLGGAMSFLGLGSDPAKDVLADEEVASAAAAAKSPGGAKPSDSPGSAIEAAGSTSSHPDPILGTWICVYPPPAPPHTTGRVFVLQGDGRYLMAEDGGVPQSGRWVRQGRTLTLTPDATSAGQTPPIETTQLLTLNARTLTIRNGNAIRVHARP